MKFDAKSIKKFLGNNVIIILLVLLTLYAGLTNAGFFGGQNIANVASNVTPRFLIALGVSGCLITKGTDLSAGRAVGLSAVIACTLLQRPDYTNLFFKDMPALQQIPVFVVLLICVAVLAIFGLANGLVVSFLKVPPFLATLGMQTIVYGINLVYSGAEPIGGLQTAYTNLATAPIFKIGNFQFRWLFLWAIAFGLIFWFLYNKTRYGKYMYAIGGNENAAEVSGINVNKSKIKIYMLAAVMYAIAGFLLAAKAGGANVNTGQGYELEAIASCTIGGVSSNGGVGKVSGILLGVLVFELLKTSMQFLKIDTSYQFIVQGAVIIFAVALDIRKYVAKK